MKKFGIAAILFLFLVGCDLSNTPTKKAEAFLKKYQTLDNNVLMDLNDTINQEGNFTTDQETTYRDIMKKHYQNLTYEIKDETIDGDSAIVTVEIEVTDFKKVLDEANLYLNENVSEFEDDAGNYNSSRFMDYRLTKMKEAKDKIKYTIYLSFTNNNNEWQLNELDTTTYDKINGVYNY